MHGPQDTQTGQVRRGTPGRSARVADHGMPPTAALLGGRYVVLERIGEGGMGVVHAAYDRELDRRVAIKVLHPGATKDYGRRLLREAQTLARLSHPNLVPVFDIGWAGDELFVAMELIGGQSLDRFAAAHRPAWREALPLLLDAGRGLAHAHRQGLVHRDFKPSNVLVGDDGRARVADFGLARPVRFPSSEVRADEPVASSPTAAGSLVTRPGETPGTPAYLPPEARDAAAFDERSDQFSFCMTAWEVLCGVRPTRNPSDGGVIATVAPGRAVPRSIRRALLRGMAVDPAARHGSMAELLARLDVAARRTRVLVLGLVATATAALGIAYVIGRGGPCDEAAGALASAWNEQRREQLRAHFEQLPGADALHDAVSSALDRYGEQWTQMRGEACVAHAIEHRQSADLFDRRMGCLDERRAALDALVGALLQTDARDVLLSAPSAARELPPVASCGDAEALLAMAWQPSTEAERVLASRLQGELGQVQALEHTGQYRVALPAADALVVDTEALPAGSPLRAKAQLLRAKLRRDNGDDEGAFAAYKAAAEAAAAAHDDGTLVAAWLELVSLLAAHVGREQEFETVAALVEGLIGRLGSPPVLRARLRESRARMAVSAGRFDDAVAHGLAAVELLGELDDPLLRARLEGSAGLDLQLAGRYEEAVHHFEQAIASSSEVLTPTHPQIGNELVNLSLLQPPAQAEASLRRAVEILRASFPDGHRDVAKALANLGLALLNRGAYDEAEATLREALAMQRWVYPSGHPHTAMTLAFLADTLNEVGRRPEALGFAREALEIRRVHLPADHADIGRALRLIASIHFDAGDVKQARADYEAALAVFDRALPPDHPLVAGALNGIGECAVLEHDAERAIEVCTRALAIERQARGEDALELVPHLSCLASAHGDRGEYELAITLLERALVLWADQDLGPLLPAQIKLQLATALDHAGRDRERVVTRATEVLAAVAAEPQARERMVAPAQRLIAGG
ncbi:MAG: tetratricopeptide repeat protein [Deltaproteobacteria bacterium]|nr:tetratricopeptide repeat protein [Deltaproteobacteria bacterium]